MLLNELSVLILSIIKSKKLRKVLNYGISRFFSIRASHISTQSNCLNEFNTTDDQINKIAQKTVGEYIDIHNIANTICKKK